jgi:hypothetical protein
MQVFVVDGVLQAATLLVDLPVLGQLFTLLIQLSKTLLQLCNLYSSAQQTLVASCVKLVQSVWVTHTGASTTQDLSGCRVTSCDEACVAA